MNAQCQLCRVRQATFEPDADGVHRGHCPVCGSYDLTFEADAKMHRPGYAPDLPFLSSYARRATDAGSKARIDTANLDSIVASMRAVPVSCKIDYALRALQLTTRAAGDWIRCDQRSAAKAVLQARTVATSSTEMNFVLSALVADGLLAADPGPTRAGNIDWETEGLSVQLTPRAWRALDSSGAVRGTCFVAMSFGPDLDPFFDKALEPAIQSAGLTVTRVDRVEHNGNINDLIVNDIRRSEVLVADFTNHKEGVYFEAGFALGLDRAVVFTCKKADFQDGRGVHFDTRPYNHILWSEDDLEDFKARLEARLHNTVPSLRQVRR